MLVRVATPEEAARATPKEDACDRCGSTSDLRLLVFCGRVRYVERTVCDECAETLFESFIDTAADSRVAQA
jgi:superfamily II helicase